jgi:hypothetical protein
MAENGRITDEQFEALTQMYAEEGRRRLQAGEPEGLCSCDPNWDEAAWDEAAHAPTPSCPSAEHVQDVWAGRAGWTAAEEEHIRTCRRCRVYVPSLSRILNLLPPQATGAD